MNQTIDIISWDPLFVLSGFIGAKIMIKNLRVQDRIFDQIFKENCAGGTNLLLLLPPCHFDKSFETPVTVSTFLDYDLCWVFPAPPKLDQI